MNRPIVRSLIVLATLLAIALGGSVDLSAQVWLAALAGLLLLVAPPRAPFPRMPLVFAGLFLLLAAMTFLPGNSTETVPWRKYLFLQCHLPADVMAGHPAVTPFLFPLDNTWTPQPWLTLQAVALLFVGLAWGLYLITTPWEREDRIAAGELLVFGVALLALLAALAFILQFHIPGWTQTENRGWFPNRNQTADVLAVCGIFAYGLIFDRLRKGKRSGYLLLGALVPIVVELVISYSRAGILLFFGGVLAWHLWPRKGSGNWRTSAKWLALSAALGIVLLAIFLTWGGDTLNRFLARPPAGATTQDITDYRGAIQLDALHFSLQSPFFGTGLGNFEPLFSFSRVASINGNRAIHPESDWLWLAGEMGWGAVALVVIACLWWLRRALPIEAKSGESMRRALIVAGVVFLVHGFVDVSAHRPGSLWVALLIFGMALPVRREQLPSAATPIVFRLLGVVVLVIAAWWGASLRGWTGVPTTATLDRLKQELQNGLPPDTAIKTADDALGIAPLDWSLYLQRGRAETADAKTFELAQQDFTIADALNPYWIALPIDEGQAWSDASEPSRGLDAWTDGLKRAGPLAPEAYRQMTGLAPQHSIMRQGLVELAFDDLGYLLTILPTTNPDEAGALIEHLLGNDPHLKSLTPAQRHDLFKAWWSQGDQVQMMEIVHEHPEWDDQTWIYQAQFAAKENDFKSACEIANRFVQRPAIPQALPNEDLADMQADFASRPDSLTLGLTLLLEQQKENQLAGAITTLEAVLKIPNAPPYLNYLGAQFYAQRGDWPHAWQAWQAYLKP